MKRTSNSNLIPLNNAEGIYDEKKGSSWVKIATIWDPELTFYSQTDTEVVIKLVDYYYKKYNLGPIDAIDRKSTRSVT